MIITFASLQILTYIHVNILIRILQNTDTFSYIHLSFKYFLTVPLKNIFKNRQK